MFPGVNGFHWSPIHIVFLTIFGLVLTTVGVTLILALYRTIRDMRLGKADGIRWHQDFEDLPANERSCRHALMGWAPGRICPRALDCRGCPDHAGFVALESQRPAEVACALDYPAHRYYHRGHTWVEPLADGTLAIGLDDLGTRIAGSVDRVELPKTGDKLSLNGTAWTMVAGRRRMRLRAPVDGEVVATGGPGQEWFLKVRPLELQPNLTHLLRGAEVSAWLRAELERLQIMVSPGTTGPTLADGGTLEHDLPNAMPKAPWDLVSDAMFLEP